MAAKFQIYVGPLMTKLSEHDQAIVDRLGNYDSARDSLDDIFIVIVAAFHAAAEREAALNKACEAAVRLSVQRRDELAALRAKMKEPTGKMVYAAKEAANKLGFDLVGAYCGTEMMRAALIAGNAEVEK